MEGSSVANERGKEQKMKKLKMLAVAAAAMVCGACAVGNSPGDGEFVIASGGHVKCTVVSNGHDGPARELAKYLGQIVGAVVPVVSNETEVAAGGRIVLATGKALSTTTGTLRCRATGSWRSRGS